MHNDINKNALRLVREDNFPALPEWGGGIFSPLTDSKDNFLPARGEWLKSLSTLAAT